VKGDRNHGERTTFLNSRLRWVKPGLCALLVGVVTAISTVIGAASNAVPVILKTLNVPDCFTYADVPVRRAISKKKARSGVNTRLTRSPPITNSRKSGAPATKSYCAI
jgi:hypothetical protein